MGAAYLLTQVFAGKSSTLSLSSHSWESFLGVSSPPMLVDLGLTPGALCGGDIPLANAVSFLRVEGSLYVPLGHFPFKSGTQRLLDLAG